MSSSVKVDIPIAYPLSFMPLRGAKEKSVVIADTVQVDVPSVGTSEAPLVVDVEYGDRRYMGREFDGGLYFPSCEAGIPAAQDAPHPFQGFLNRHENAHHHLFPAGIRRDLYELHRKTPVERPTGLTRVVSDGHDEVRSAAIEAAREFLMIDGALFRRSAPPMIAFLPTAESKWMVQLDSGTSWYPKHYGFALGRIDEAKAFRERVIERGGVNVDGLGVIRIKRLEWATHEQPEAARNASSGVTHVLSSLGNDLYRYPPEMIRLALELSLARGEACRPARDPIAINLLLRELLEAIPAKDGLWLRRHIPNALDAIASSQDFVAERLHDDDIEALSGLSP